MTQTADRVVQHKLALSHYSDHARLIPQPVAQSEQVSTYAKPMGLWVSVDGPDDWAAWCAAEGFRDTSAQHRHRITLRADARVLHLTDVEQLYVFDRQFARPDRFMAGIEGIGTGWNGIDWAAVAERYCGIIIAPYQWHQRLSRLRWYYSWDCASGCIWDPDAIERVDESQEDTGATGVSENT